MCAVHQVAPCEYPKTATVLRLSSCCLSCHCSVSPCASHIAQSLASQPLILPVPRYLRQVIHSFLSFPGAAAHTWPLSECDKCADPSQPPALMFASFDLAHGCAAPLVVLLPPSIIFITRGPSPVASQLMPMMFRPCLYSVSKTQHIGVLDEGSFCSSYSVLLHAFASLTVNHCCLESKITGTCVIPDFHFNVPLGVVRSKDWTALACQSR
jgi:hypothetical protein